MLLWPMLIRVEGWLQSRKDMQERWGRKCPGVGRPPTGQSMAEESPAIAIPYLLSQLDLKPGSPLAARHSFTVRVIPSGESSAPSLG